MPSQAARDFGVQSYCFRNFKDNAEVAKMVTDIGLNKIEVCAVHADFEDLTGWKKIVDTYKAAGVDIVSIGVQTFRGEPQEELWLDCAAVAGARHVSAHFTVDTFQTAVPLTAKRAADRGLRIGVHCHGGYMFGGSPDVLKHLLEVGGDTIGVNIDTAWCMQIGPGKGNPVQWVRDLFPQRIYGVHYKDFVFESNGAHRDVVVGEGYLDLPAFLAALDEVNFDGMAVIEYEGDVENPVPALKQCVDSMRSVA
ncbi:MAG: sugar phosphate isomerase/epimerase family protein [Phycisphaeraceae bacterium]